MNTAIGNEFPRMKSASPAMIMAMPPKKSKVPETPAMEEGLLPWNWRRQKMVEEKGTRKPTTPTSVGFPVAREDRG